MELQLAVNLEYQVSQPSTLTFHIQPEQSVNETIVVSPQNCTLRYGSTSAKKILVVDVTSPGIVTIRYDAVARPSYSFIDCASCTSINIATLPDEVYAFLNPSRYCESDLLEKFAKDFFGNYPTVFDTVFAITEWIKSNVTYESGSTNNQTTATATIVQRKGVCRDFAHLAIAICRALHIPARYCAVYAFQLMPQDFHACFEVYIGHTWIVFDATGLAPLNGMIRIATGLDAADTFVGSLYGDVQGSLLTVAVTSTYSEFSGIYYQPGQLKGIHLG